jgi:Response regulator containing CheY-like receiver, AAA-type ATPase, and DNA-binding domains
MPAARILLVDDEAPLLRLMETYLGRMGYSLEACVSATEALQLFKNSAQVFDLAIVDLTMPEMPGETLALRLLEINPNIRILLCSGYPYDVSGLPASIRRHFAVLQKPFAPKMLDKAVGDLLRRKLDSYMEDAS